MGKQGLCELLAEGYGVMDGDFFLLDGDHAILP